MSEKIDFISGCPGFGCDNSKKAYTWKHHNCGGTEWLDENGYLECKVCHLRDILISWKFKCNGHSDFRDVNREKICEILSMTASLEKGSKKFKKKILKAVSDMIDDD